MFQSVLNSRGKIELIWQSKALRIHVCFSALQCPNSQSLSNPLVQFTLSSLIHMTGFNPCTYLLTFVIHFYSNWNEYHMHTSNLPWCIFYQIFNSMYADRKIFKWYCKHSFSTSHVIYHIKDILSECTLFVFTIYIAFFQILH